MCKRGKLKGKTGISKHSLHYRTQMWKRKPNADTKSAFKSTDEETRNVEIKGLNLRMEIKVEKVSLTINLLCRARDE